MSINSQFSAAAEFAAAFGAAPTGPVAVLAVRDHDFTGTGMTKFFGQAPRPRKTPL
jgi:hypothetical protein